MISFYEFYENIKNEYCNLEKIDEDLFFKSLIMTRAHFLGDYDKISNQMINPFLGLFNHS